MQSPPEPCASREPEGRGSCDPLRPASPHLRDASVRSVGYENQINERGERLIWLEPNVVKRLRAMRGPGESFSDAILRLVAHAESDEAR